MYPPHPAPINFVRVPCFFTSLPVDRRNHSPVNTSVNQPPIPFSLPILPACCINPVYATVFCHHLTIRGHKYFRFYDKNYDIKRIINPYYSYIILKSVKCFCKKAAGPLINHYEVINICYLIIKMLGKFLRNMNSA